MENLMNDTSRWLQANVTFPDWDHAEGTAASRLAPALDADGTADGWWFIRKHPCWRIRYRPAAGSEAIAGRCLDALAREGHIAGWSAVIYEPETRAFGGPEAMTEAHSLFHADSHGALAYLRGEPKGTHRREVTLMLCSIMMRAARQDWYEQGDIWARVAGHRMPPTGPRPAGPSPAAVRHFLTANAEEQMRNDASLASCGQWADAYAAAGRELASLAAGGQLCRGLRDVLAHHVIFAWNRIGLSHAAQSALAGTARTVVFGPDPEMAATR
jgi:thiopeptide-type bacteriocin biosynthesis protein